MLLLARLTLLLAYAYAQHIRQPNIVLIIADDLGWNDVGFHGLNNIPTPNIDALAASGLVLQNHYVAPACSPSRAALMTGKYPIHTGMQHKILFASEPRGLPLSEKLLPQYLKELGYRTHLIGKWHLGFYKKEYLPMSRGFDSHVGFWTSKIDMYDHTNQQSDSWGHDFKRGFKSAYEFHGKYATDIYTDEANNVVQAHNKSEPLFLMVAHSAVHSGNSYEPLRAPDSVIEKFEHIDDTKRRKYAAVLSKLDESVGKLVQSLQTHGLLENTVIVFSTDNGGVVEGFRNNAGSNYPLRGTKSTVWEGAVRGSAVLWSPIIEKKSRVAKQRLHLVDWLPTLLSVAGGNSSVLQGLDGVDVWSALSKDEPSPRTSVVHNIDDISGIAAITVDKWKIVNGSDIYGDWDRWYGPDGREGSYDEDLVYTGLAGQAINQLGLMPPRTNLASIREAATVKCDESLPVIECKPMEAPCLFDIEEDPCERRNLAEQHPEILQRLLNELSTMSNTAVPPNNKPDDPRSNPNLWGHVYTNFGDYEIPYNSANCI